MARALAGGMTRKDPAQALIFSDPNRDQLDAAGRLGEAQVTTDNDEAIAAADVVVLAVKPQRMREVCKALAPAVLKHQPLIISIAAGISTRSLVQWLGGHERLVRAMPNTPALVSEGATGLYATPAVSAEDRDHARAPFDAVGYTMWVEEEDLLHAVTALSGSGPAYFFFLMEIMEAHGVEQGLSAEQSHSLALATARGAAAMASADEKPLSQLRTDVTSPGGTTEAALRAMVEGQLDRSIRDGMDAAARRSGELAEEYGRRRS
ncbi:MAG: pyrroline-5-carboxylate reductase [Xanthomonadales bacterium]|nr:pyrroline-5-carboxylate reductase [Xanthomonadales bacterium]